MKKIIALILTLTLFICNVTAALAAGEQSGTTTLTAVVPGPSYTIHIPADTTLEYGNTEIQEIGDYWVSDFVNIPELSGVKGIRIMLYVTCLINGSDSIPVTYCYKTGTDWSSPIETNVTYSDGSKLITSSILREDYHGTEGVRVAADDWNSATPGTYTATMTFNFSIPE